MGLFDIQLSVNYGEGGEKAFFRLQEEIVKGCRDMSLFAWEGACSRYNDMFAAEPACFKGGLEVELGQATANVTVRICCGNESTYSQLLRPVYSRRRLLTCLNQNFEKKRRSNGDTIRVRCLYMTAIVIRMVSSISLYPRRRHRYSYPYPTPVSTPMNIQCSSQEIRLVSASTSMIHRRIERRTNIGCEWV